MSSPTAEAPYRPLPEAPSPVWARAGRGLGLMAFVALAQVPFVTAAGVVGIVARDHHRSGYGAQPLDVASAAVVTVVHAGASIVTAYALAAVAALPVWTRTRGLARASLALCVVAFAKPFAAQFAMGLVARAELGAARGMMIFAAATFALDLALATALTAALAVLLARLATSLDAPRPRRLWGLVALGFVLHLLSPLTTALQYLGGRGSVPPALVALLALTALWALQSWGWARALRSVGRLVGAQSLPASAAGPRGE